MIGLSKDNTIKYGGKVMKRKVVALLLTACMSMSLLACGSSEPVAEESATVEGTTEVVAEETTEEVAEETSEEITEIDMWGIWSSAEISGQVLLESIEKVESEYPVKINLDITENEAYKTKIKAAVAADEAPDIFFTYGLSFNQPFVEAGKLLDVTDYVTQETTDQIVTGALSNYTFNDRLYGLVCGNAVSRLYVNTEIFEQNNLEIPTTYDELLEVSAKLREIGITPIALGGKDTWMVAKIFDIIGLRYVGLENLDEILRGEAAFNGEKMLKAAEAFDEMAELGVFTENPLAITADEAKASFLQGNAAMIYNGTFIAGDMSADSSLVKGKVTAVPFPTFADGDGVVTEFIGGAGDGFVINANVENPQLLVDVLNRICYYNSDLGYLAGVRLPVYVNDTVGEDPILEVIKEDTFESTGYQFWWDSTLEGSLAQDYISSLIELLDQSIEPQDFVDSVEASIRDYYE